MAVDPSEELRYPTSQGLARQGTWLHADALTQAYQALRRHFRGRDDLFIAPTLCLYYVRDGEERCLIPDLFVALDVAHAPRRIYKVWGEGKVPDFVLELSSESTMHRPKGFKCDRYRSLGVQEYWQLDTVGDLLDSHPRGYRLERGGFEEIAASGSREGHSEFRSDVLGLRLRAAPHAGGATLAFRDPLTGEDILAGRALDRKLHEIELSKRAERRRRIRAEKERIHNEKERDSERRGRRRAEERARIAEEQVQAAEGRARIAEGRVQAAAERVRKLEAMLRNRGVSQLELEF